MGQNFNNTFSSIVCPLCNTFTNLITDQESTETICTNCGFTLPDDIMQNLYEHTRILNKDEECSAVRDYGCSQQIERYSNPLAIHDNGLYTIIGKTIRDATGQKIDNQTKNLMNRLRIWDSRTQIKNSKERNLFNALAYLQKLKYELGLPDSVIEKTAYIYRKIQDNEIVKNRKVKMVISTACYIACRQIGIPRTLSELAEISDTEEKTLSKFYRDLILDLDLKVPKIDPMKMLIKIANVCNISEKTKRYAIRLMSEIIKENLFISKDPKGVAGTVVYMACKKYGEKILQYEIATASYVTIVTIRKNQKFISRYLKNSI
jgi:transcription initiation factor TFIIB